MRDPRLHNSEHDRSEAVTSDNWQTHKLNRNKADKSVLFSRGDTNIWNYRTKTDEIPQRASLMNWKKQKQTKAKMAVFSLPGKT